jgi:hypothetical protein
MNIENLTNPGVAPVDGDRVKITHGSGAIEIKEYRTPVDPGPAPTVYKILTKLQAIQVLMTEGGMTPAELVTAREDPNLKFYWMVWEFAGTDDVNRDSPNTAAVLAALRDNGYITQGELDAIMANWPTE